MLNVVNSGCRRGKRGTPLSPEMALAVVGGINELVLHAIERDRVAKLQELVDPAVQLVRAVA